MFLIIFSVKGHVSNWLFLYDFKMDAFVGENSAGWKKDISYFLLNLVCALLSLNVLLLVDLFCRGLLLCPNVPL
jgi:hypothetical protein